MKARFVISLKENKFAKGVFYILSDNEQILFEKVAWSGSKFAGPNNKGWLPEGDYQIVSCYFDSNPSYTRDNYGWIAGLKPLFDVGDRFGFAIHPDGKTLSVQITKGEEDGSAGCIVSDFTIDESVKCHNLLEEGLKLKGVIPLLVMTVNQPWTK